MRPAPRRDASALLSCAVLVLLAFAWPPLPARAQSPEPATTNAPTPTPSADETDAKPEAADDDAFDYDAYESEEEDDEVDAYEEAPEPDLDMDPRWSGIEELRVTGKAGQTVDLEAAESALQFDSAELEAMGVADITDIGKITPNLEIRQSDATNANFFIRGVGLADFSANSASAVAIFQDGVPLNASAIQLVGLFDASGVTVERGPQGAGSARNATAGAIRIDSQLPTGELQAKLRTTFATYSSDVALDGALIMDYEGAVEVPVYEDLLSARVAFRVHDADPFMINGCGDAPPISERIPRAPGNINDASICGERDDRTFPIGSVSPIPVGLPSEVGDEGDWAARGILRFQPDVLDMDWLLNFHGGQLDQQSTLGQASGTLPTLGRATDRDYFEPDQLEEWREYRLDFIDQGFTPAEARDMASEKLAEILATGRPLDRAPYRGDYNRVGKTTRDSFGTGLKGYLLFEDVPLVESFALDTITAYDQYSRFRDTDQDFTPIVLFERVQDDSAWQFYQELRTSGENHLGTLRWEAGGYYLMEKLDSEFSQFTVSPNFDFFRTFEQDLWSFAFYGGFGWDFLDSFTLDAGVRYNWERKSFSFEQIPLGVGVPDIAVPQTETWTAPTGLVSLTYRITPDVSAYVKYSRGWKGGHFNANRPNLPDDPVPPARPETLDAVEFGTGGAFFDSRVLLSGSLFYYKYKDYQVFLFEPSVASPPILEIVNAESVEQYGAEIETTVRPLADVGWVPEELENLDLTLRFGWLQSQFLDFVNVIELLDPRTLQVYRQEVNYTGNRLPNAPKFKLSGVLQWPFDLAGLGTLTPRYDFDWTDDVSFGPNEGRGTLTTTGDELPDGTIGQKAFVRHNIRLSYVTPDGMIEVSGWVRNIGDVRYKTYAFDASIFANDVISFVGDPRTGGVDLSIRF